MNTKNLCIVDDDPEITNLLSFALGRAGFAVDTAADYRQALAVVGDGSRHDVILMDYFLPDIDGITLARMLSEKGVPVPVVLFTAAETEGLTERFPPTIIGTIKKPFSMDDVIANLDGIIKMRRLCATTVMATQAPVPAAPPETLTKGVVDIIYTEKAASLKSLLSRLSHDVKNSLQTISTHVELLEKGYVDEDDKGRVYGAIKKKIHEIRGHLDVLKNPEESYLATSFSLKNAVRASLDAVHEETRRKDIFVRTEFQRRLPLYYGRKGLFTSFISDIIVKTVECMPPAARLEVSVFGHQQEYMIEISQSRSTADCQNYLRFFDMPAAGGDAGLTRAIVNLKELGGKIHVEPLADTGTLFRITLPMRRVDVSG